jgi:glycosyltransferase involved in cell wall biosynthesis
MFLLMRWFFPRFERVVCVSSGVAADLKNRFHLPQERISVIPPAVPLAEVQRLGSTVPCGDPWLDDKSLPVVVAVGGLRRAKGFDNLIRAFALVRPGGRVRLIVIGEGESRSCLEDLIRRLGIEQSVRLRGFESNPYKFMSKADAVVVSSRWEGFCLVIAEALALGTPVISTDCLSGPAEILEGGSYGQLVPVDDERALANSLRDVLQGEVVATPATRRARSRAFAAEVVTESYHSLLRSSARQPMPQSDRA